jgi:hypothetical protein
MVKSTYVLDVESAQALERLAGDWQVSKSEALRRVLKQAVALPPPDRAALLRQLQQAAGLSRAAVDRWAASVRAERRARPIRAGARSR